MSILEYIKEKETAMYEDRLNKLIDMGAPEILITNQRKVIAGLKAGKIQVGGDSELLAYNFSSYVVCKGRGGKVYIQFDGKINYFPHAKYGRYIALAK